MNAPASSARFALLCALSSVAALSLAGALCGCGGPSVNVDAPFAVVFVSPEHGTAGVARDVEPRVGFNRELAVNGERGARLFTFSGVAVGEEIATTALIDDTGTVAVLVPERPLSGDADVALVVDASTAATDGVALGAELRAVFHTQAE